MSVPKIFLDFFEKCNIKNTKDFLNKAKQFQNILQQENSKHNLTRIENDTEFWDKHISDSISISWQFSEFATSKINIIDIGCGAGFPSIVLAIAFPDLNITAIDSVGKKVIFVNYAAKELGLNNIKALHIRSKEFKPENKFDVITARAVGEPFKIFKESKKLLTANGRYILYRTPENLEEDLIKINKLTSNAKFKWNSKEIFSLPAENGRRVFIVGQRETDG